MKKAGKILALFTMIAYSIFILWVVFAVERPVKTPVEKIERDTKYVIYYTKDSTENVYRVEEDGSCGNFIVKRELHGIWSKLKRGTYLMVLPLDSLKN